MTEITRVPLKPIEKGSLTKLWLGVFVAVAVGAGVAVMAADISWNWGNVEIIEELDPKEPGGPPQRLTLETIVKGSGPTAEIGQVAFTKYRGYLAEDETQFDEYRPIPWPAPDVFPEGIPFFIEEGQTVEGFFKGLQRVQAGGEYKLTIPAQMGYGDRPPPGAPIPPGADLVFELEIVDIMDRAEFEEGMAKNDAAFRAQQPQLPQGLTQ